MKFLSIFILALSMTSLRAEIGEVTVSKQSGVVKVKITGLAAKEIANKLTHATITTKTQGSLITTTKSGKNISCTVSSAFTSNAECRFSVNSSGVISPLSKLETQAAANGVARTVVYGKLLNIQITGKASDIILSNLTQISESGTMTLTKESNDIRCSKVREFNSKNSGSCQTNIDSVGSTTSK